MTDAVQSMERILSSGRAEGTASAAEEGVEWHDAVAAMAEVLRSEGSEVDTIIRDVLAFDGRIPLKPDSELPHAMSPEDMLRFITLEKLDKTGIGTYRAEIIRIAEVRFASIGSSFHYH